MFKLIFRYLFHNKDRKSYRTIAMKHKSTTWNVYRIAHGKNIRTLRDGSIYRELFRQGIIS
jgi:hypothetical protein